MNRTPAEQHFQDLLAIEVASQVAKMRGEILATVRAEIAAEVKRLDHRINLSSYRGEGLP